MSHSNWHVVKVGGSLLDDPLLARRLGDWLAAQNGPMLLVAGGGRFVEALRRFDQLHGMSEEAAHWLAIDLMDVTSRLLGELIPAAEAIQELPPGDGQPAQIVRFLPARYLKTAEIQAPGRVLPVGWQVTSDSIAARIAEVMQAKRLTLLKSSVWPSGKEVSDWNAAADAGYVDADFPQRTRAIPRVEAIVLPRGRGPIPIDIA